MLHYWHHVETGIGGVMCFDFFSRFLFPSRFSATGFDIDTRLPKAFLSRGLFFSFFFPHPRWSEEGEQECK